jgi:predicted amidohydrolase
MICADGRLPELAREAGDAAARLLIEPTAWVSSGRDASKLSNPQAEFLMPARAIEQGAWVLAADKVGVEAGSIVYAGRSGIIDPQGQWVIQAPSDRPGMILHTIDLDAAAGPALAWQPALGAAYLEAGPARVSEQAREPLIVEDAAAHVAAVSLEASPSAVELMEQARELVLVAAAQDAALAVLPDLAGAEPFAPTQDELLPLLQSLASEAHLLVAVTLAERTNAHTYKTLYLLDRGEVIAAHRQTHLTAAEREAGYSAGDRPPPVIETMVGHAGLLAAAEGLVPELAGALKRQGAELLLWSTSEAVPAPVTLFARTRALEQRCYVLAASGSGPAGGAAVAAPGGALLGETLEGEAMALGADVNRAFARWNDMAPGTSAVRDHERGAWAGA